MRVSDAQIGAKLVSKEVPILASGKAKRRREVLPLLEGALLGSAVVFPLVFPDYLTVFATRAVVLSLFALSFDMIWGYGGILSFGQALFFGSAGYGVAIMARDLGVTSVVLVLPAAMLIGLVIALLFAAFLFFGKKKPTVAFVALGTLAGSYGAERIARGWYYLGGQNGIPSIPPMTFGSYEILEGPTYYYLALAVLVLSYLGCRFIVRSQFGLALAAVREQETRVAFFGYRTSRIKAVVFGLSGAMAGLSGGLYTFHEGFVWPTVLGIVLSTQVMLYVLFGGAGSLLGAVLGAMIIEAMSFWLSGSYQEVWPMVLGMLLLAVILFRPSGLIGMCLSERERVGSFGRGRNDVTS